MIGPDDVLSIVYWRDKEMSSEVRVRPDGRIALPLINEVVAAGLTPEALQQKITEESTKFMEDASITVVVKEINSLKVFITGEVNKPGPYPLTSATTVIQLISQAGGLREYANSKNILIMRKEADRQVSLKFNYQRGCVGQEPQAEHRPETWGHGDRAVMIRFCVAAMLLVPCGRNRTRESGPFRWTLRPRRSRWGQRHHR